MCVFSVLMNSKVKKNTENMFRRFELLLGILEAFWFTQLNKTSKYSVKNYINSVYITKSLHNIQNFCKNLQNLCNRSHKNIGLLSTINYLRGPDLFSIFSLKNTDSFQGCKKFSKKTKQCSKNSAKENSAFSKIQQLNEWGPPVGGLLIFDEFG